MDADYLDVLIEHGPGKVELPCSLSGIEMEAFLGVDQAILDLAVDLTGPQTTIALALDDRYLETLHALPTGPYLLLLALLPQMAHIVSFQAQHQLIVH